MAKKRWAAITACSFAVENTVMDNSYIDNGSYFDGMAVENSVIESSGVVEGAIVEGAIIENSVMEPAEPTIAVQSSPSDIVEAPVEQTLTVNKEDAIEAAKEAVESEGVVLPPSADDGK